MRKLIKKSSPRKYFRGVKDLEEEKKFYQNLSVYGTARPSKEQISAQKDLETRADNN
jgi:hypothetical protein